MAGLYLHIPYCKQACSYCDFYFSTVQKSRPQLVQAMVLEMVLQRNYFGDGCALETVYWGGGTPSLLNLAEAATLMQAIRQHYTLVPGAEITLEANPDDMEDEKLKGWLDMGFNRLSVGIQSFQDSELRQLGRVHDAAMASAAVWRAQRAGFDNISIDLMFNLPKQDMAAWQHNVHQALELPIQHVSAYGLTVEPRTLLANQIAAGKVHMPDEATFAAQYAWVMAALEQAGLAQYEVSNYARPGYKSRHNSNYWQQAPYLGLGPSAHSYDGRHQRHWNHRNLHQYIDVVMADALPIETSETLTPEQLAIEYLMLGLRTQEGIDPARLTHYTDGKGQAWQLSKQPTLSELEEKQHLAMQQGRYVVTANGRPFTDSMVLALMHS